MWAKMDNKIAIVGLGYVGLPLAFEFGKKAKTIGFDVNVERVEELKTGYDRTMEIETAELKTSHLLSYTTSLYDIADCNIYIVTVPTPVDRSNQPDLSKIRSASEMIGSVLKKNDIVIYESTVFPGCTRRVCVPILEGKSGLSLNKGFFIGYSPERVNPGDKEHRIPDIIKVTSGSTPEIAQVIDDLYASIITAGTFKAASIEVAEAAKVIENTQRDLNIALMNELAVIFHKLDIDTHQVLDAATTKWNFLRFTPGLVGGHCIGVDPYYLTHRAQQVGHNPEIILAGRRINDSMSGYVAGRVVKDMMKKNIHVANSKILVLGLSFKENCPDLRNSKVKSLIEELESYNVAVDVYDPWVKKNDVKAIGNLSLLEGTPLKDSYDAIVLAVGHDKFIELGPKGIRSFGKKGHLFFDVKAIFDINESDGRL